MEHSAELKTVQKWEKEFKCSLTKEIKNRKVVSVKCDLCVKYVSRLRNLRSFTPIWVTGSTSVKKDSVKKHVNGEAHLMAVDLDMKESLGASKFNEKIVESSPIGQALAKMAESDKETMRVCFNTVYYLAKLERPFSDFPQLLSLQQKNGVKKFENYKNDRAAANFCDATGKTLKDDLVKDSNYSLLTDGSTDSGVLEQELIYVLFLNRSGRAEVKFFGIESPDHANAVGLKEAVELAFNRVGITDFASSLFGLNVDGASVNTGIHGGLGALLRQSAEWLIVVHCFNHRLELAAQDAFKGTFFDEVDTMLTKLFYLYQKSPKRLRELREFSEIFEKSVPKPAKAGGTRWIGHKMRALNIVLQNYGVFITHLESLAKTDSQDTKRAEIAGFVSKWRHAKFPLYIAMYLDILQPLKVLSVSMQKEEHDPVLILRRVRDFNWTMAKLDILVKSSLGGSTQRLTNYSKFLQNVCEDDEGTKTYQSIELKQFDSSCESLKENYGDMVTKLSSCVEGRFADLDVNVIFKHLLTVLDVSIWPTENKTHLTSYGDKAMEELVVFLKSLLQRNGCKVELISTQWDVLKSRVCDMVVDVLDVWSKVFTNISLKAECADVLHVINLLLITPFTNAKVERLFSRMKRVKTDWRNKLRRDRLESLLRISEEGVCIDDYNPDKAIEQWYQEKVRRISSAKSHSYPKKRKKVGGTTPGVVNVARHTLSDLEESSSSDSDE